jgi:site-specific DNA-methyltransferase (adenine-specific)
MMRVNEVYEGDCLDVMREFPDNCIDSIITDPPYGLEFMGKDWDYGIPGVAYWREALRIAKPGATLMAFGGSRTYHRLVCAIEDAGWEIRDCIMWVYGSGFPKSHDVSKGIDKAAGAEREVVGESPYKSRRPNSMNGTTYNYNSDKFDCTKDLNITAPATPLAAKFDGYGTALKPAHEPIVLAMKPIDQGFAANAEKWGVSGLWIDGGRVGTDTNDDYGRSPNRADGTRSRSRGHSFGEGLKEDAGKSHPNGRYPANVIHDGSEEVMAEFDKAGVRTTGGPGITQKNDYSNSMNTGSHRTRETIGYSDSGSAARFFQQCPPDPPQSNPCLDCTDCIIETEAPKGRWPANVIHDGSEEVMAEFDKAGVRGGHGGGKSAYTAGGFETGGYSTDGNYQKIPRNWGEGSAARFFAQCPPDPTAHPEAARFHYCPKAGKRERGQGNNHPTVKPLSLLRYLAKLTRPPDGGIVLDPFGGSGTTALACIAEGRDYIIIEKEPEYAELCRRRIAEYSGKEVAPVEVKVKSEVVKQMSLW